MLAALKQGGGFLLAVPDGVIPAEFLDRVSRGSVVAGGGRSQTGEDMTLRLVDVRSARQHEASGRARADCRGLRPRLPLYALPVLLSSAWDWIQGAGEDTGLNFN